MHALREQQLAFARALCDANGAQAAQVREVEPFTAEQRLQIYHNNWAISLRQALAGVYPVINKLVGEEFFAYAAGAYLQAHPSRTGNVHDFGDAFPTFLAQLAGAESLPYLPDVARLEWAYHEVFHAPEGMALDVEQLAVVLSGESAEQVTAACNLYLQLSPCCRYVQSDYPILSIWQLNQDAGSGNEVVDIGAGGMQLALVRNNIAIEFHPLSAAAYTLLAALHSGDSFAQACVRALAAHADCNVGSVLQYCVQHRLITGFSLT
jgi:hypothetical protein